MKDWLFVCLLFVFSFFFFLRAYFDLSFAIRRLPRRIKAASVCLMLDLSGLEHAGSAGFPGFINSGNI